MVLTHQILLEFWAGASVQTDQVGINFTRAAGNPFKLDFSNRTQFPLSQEPTSKAPFSVSKAS